MKHKDLSEVGWIPLLELKYKTWIGVSENECWVAGSIGETRPSVELAQPPSIALLPCLERPYSDFVTRLRTGLAEAGLPLDVVTRFPFTRAIEAGLLSCSDYWVELALNWLETAGASFEVGEDLRRALTTAMGARKRLSQRLRQRVARTLREVKSGGM